MHKLKIFLMYRVKLPEDESLQEKVNRLEQENQELRAIISRQITELEELKSLKLKQTADSDPEKKVIV